MQSTLFYIHHEQGNVLKTTNVQHHLYNDAFGVACLYRAWENSGQGQMVDNNNINTVK